MNVEFVAKLAVPNCSYEWYDSEDYSRLLIGDSARLRKRSKAAQRRLRLATDKFQFADYDPFKTAPAMFLEFADLEATEMATLSFINRYGTLWGDLLGPSLADYEEAIADLRNAIELWRAVENEDATALGRFLHWSQGQLQWTSAFARPLDVRGRTVHFIDVKHPGRIYETGDLLGPATDLLDFIIESRPTWSSGIVPKRRDGAVTFYLEVDTQLSVLWIQFALAVAESKKFEHCQFCQRPFELAPQFTRADRVFCSANCRVKSYQRRKKQAIDLHRQGKTLRQIASATDSNAEQVKKWISNESDGSNRDDKEATR